MFPFAAADWNVARIARVAATDLADGRIARAIGAAGRVGKYLDSAADKVFVAIVLVTLVVRGSLLPTDLALLAGRDIVVLAGTAGLLVASRQDVVGRLDPSALGNVTTFGQFLYLVLVVRGGQRYPAALAVVGTVGFLAGLDHVRRGWRALARPVAAAELS